ncbi:doublecortin domain-containing protein 2-like [Pseudoliparis swirei]|uniref:doublecortin domain-containing protein 2-like n=1 Tax=Pseudoliparis swirei TaxID=2059687 RepID=UPI0024BE7F34|nr:doublecortin domain-containing protein 2-like [Pseudoliparis swirei]
MSSERPNFLSQPVVKNVFMYRNGDPYYDARRIVINHKRVANFETLLREVTGGIQAPFGAVRNIYTPRGGHKVDCLESLQSGEQYVAAGRERFKRLDYLHIGSRRKKMMQTLPMHAKPLPPNRIVVSARFLKPIKEPCTIFAVANGDVLNPAMRLLIHQRMLGHFERILEMITERMGMKVFGGVQSLYTYEGHQVTDGDQMESGQLYVAVGRERFKKLPYSDLLFTKPRGTRRVNGMKAYSLPPIFRFSKQNGNSKSMVRCSDSGDGEPKASPPSHNGSKNHLSSIVREMSQARLMSLRKKRSGQSMTLGISDNDDLESKADDEKTEDKTPQDEPAVENPPDDATKASVDNVGTAGDKEEAVAENTTEEDPSTNKEEMKGHQERSGKGGEGNGKNAKQNDDKGGETAAPEKNEEEEVEKDVQEVVTDERKEEVKREERGSSSSNSDKAQDREEKEDGGHTSSEGKIDERDKKEEEKKQDKDSENGERSSEDQVNDEDMGEEQQEAENSCDPEKIHSDNETKESDKGRNSSRGSNREEDGSKTKGGATKEAGEEKREVNGEVSGEDDEVERGMQPDTVENSSKDATANGENEVDNEEENRDKNREEGLGRSSMSGAGNSKQ